MGKKNIRLDQYLVNKGLSASRENAGKEILAGWVKVNSETVREPFRFITGQEKIVLENPRGRFVSRGGEKLARALEEFKISLSGLNTADLGASTGGFTDCMLKAGASLVYAVDVGYGQVDYSLRKHGRVILKERTNVMKLESGSFNHKINFIAADLSFISIVPVYRKIKKIFCGANGVFLVKPQFEAVDNEHDKGVVRDSVKHSAILKRVLTSLINSGLIFKGLTYSPLKGPAGNIEFLLYFKVDGESSACNNQIQDLDLIINKVVQCAHAQLNNIV